MEQLWNAFHNYSIAPQGPTTKLYDRTKDEITLSEVERIRL
jgi:hypothetical protein